MPKSRASKSVSAKTSAKVATASAKAADPSTSERYRFEMWDRKSPVNGCSAEVLLAQPDVAEAGDVVLIYRDDVLVYLQTTDPEQGGAIGKGQGTQVAETLIPRLVEGDLQRVEAETAAKAEVDEAK